MNENEDLEKLAPGSVIACDSLLMRTRFGNWVSDGGYVVSNEDLAADVAYGHRFTVIFNAEGVSA